ncbi:hypothetical protein [Bifidobacterium callitrichos]|uniref:RNA helicase domain protein n=1 Tax=Bifidobacterium callitrichos DSM 23973 TaxID=1437609 RepID=A0A087ABV2_9BIFI|nr:hypothetical protein [Bifidobacterium callitrichos]KFI56252.1 RNA helicase domain protein [Bifidobacterium callitrichos DSM 23973]
MTDKDRTVTGDGQKYSRCWMLRISKIEDYEWHGTPRHQDIEWSDICSAFHDAYGSGFAINGQLEKGTKTGYLHFQVLLITKYEKKGQAIIDAIAKRGIHIGGTEKLRKNIYAGVRYTSKDATRVERYDPFGDADLVRDIKRILNGEQTQGARNDLNELRRAIVDDHMTVDDILRDPDLSIKSARYVSWLDRLQRANSVTPHEATEQRDVKAHYLYGSPRIGKTRLIYDNISVNQFYRVTDYQHPFDSYVGQKVLVLDEYDSQFPITSINNFLDRYGCELPARYHNSWANWDEVWVISNLPINSQYSDDNTDKKNAFIARFTDITYMDKSGLFYDAADDDVLSDMLDAERNQRPWGEGNYITSPWVFGKSRFIENPDLGFL